MNYGILNIKIHQLFSFSKTFATLESGQAIFWPGCAILSLGDEIVSKTFQQLRLAIPDLAYSTLCCGKPSTHIDGGKGFSPKKFYMQEEFQKKGVKTIYTLCPNCQTMLTIHSGVTVKSAWPILDASFPPSMLHHYKDTPYALPDPCPSGNTPENHVAVRNILNKLGIKVLEFKNNREKTICCGKKEMQFILNPQKSKKLFALRAAQAPSRRITSYCGSCIHSFRSNGFESAHVLELLWKTPSDGSWKKRLHAVGKIKRRTPKC